MARDRQWLFSTRYSFIYIPPFMLTNISHTVHMISTVVAQRASPAHLAALDSCTTSIQLYSTDLVRDGEPHTTYSTCI